MRQRKPIRHKLLVPLLLLGVLTASAQDDNFQVRTRVDLVVVPVSVKASDRLVSGLGKTDFVIREDGREQTITNFSDEPVPLSAAVIVNTGLSNDSLNKVKSSIPALLGSFSDTDEVAVYRYDKYVDKVVDFNQDKAFIEAAMSVIKDMESVPLSAPGGPFSTPGPVINGRPVVPGPVVGVSPPSPPRQVLHDAIFQAAADLSRREKDRRKMVLLISNGTANGNDHSYDETVERLLDSGVQIYAVGMDVAFIGRKLSVLDSYAADTGGDACFLSSMEALETCYMRSAEQARNQYVLGYVSSNKVAENVAVFRDIDVEVLRDGYSVRHRKGYYQYP